MRGRSPDVLVLGGGPAGCAAARVLAACGHDVLMVAWSGAERRPLPESIPPSTAKLFDVLGVRAAVDAAGFVRSSGNTVWWGAGPARVEHFEDGGRGWQVTADRLELLLRKAAIDAGARVVVQRMTAVEADAMNAAYTLDCTGRAGVMARARDLRSMKSNMATVALVGLWRVAKSSIADPSHTWIESYGSGWAWSVPASSDHRYFAVMVDPRTSELVHDRGALAAYTEELQKTQVFSRVIGTGSLVEGPAGWDASMYSARHYRIDNVLLVGDAGSFIDPLASIGVKKALASGWLAAIAAHTALVRPSMREVAFEFFAAREREVFASFEQLTVEQFADAAASHGHPFWTSRADGASTPPPMDERLVQAAFERMKAAGYLRWRRPPALRIEERPAVSGSEIVLERRVVSDEAPSGVRFLYDVDVLALIELAPTVTQVSHLFEIYNRSHAPVSMQDFLTALSTLVAREWLTLTTDH